MEGGWVQGGGLGTPWCEFDNLGKWPQCTTVGDRQNLKSTTWEWARWKALVSLSHLARAHGEKKKKQEWSTTLGDSPLGHTTNLEPHHLEESDQGENLSNSSPIRIQTYVAPTYFRGLSRIPRRSRSPTSFFSQVQARQHNPGGPKVHGKPL